MTLQEAFGLYNYWIVIFLMMTGFYLVIARGNLIKTIIGLNIFQTSVVLMYVTMGKVSKSEGGKGAPILPESELHGHGHDDHGHSHAEEHVEHGSQTIEHATEAIEGVVQQAAFLDDADKVAHSVGAHEHADHVAEAAGQGAELLYTNPLPSVLMLTAIVVGVATTALALALTVRIREEYGTIEEDEILELDRNS